MNAHDHDAADWESDDSDVRSAGMHFESDAVHVEHEFDDVDLDLHANKGSEVFLVATDDSTDQWVSTKLSLGPEAAEQLGEQLILAARYAREDEQADIRL